MFLLWYYSFETRTESAWEDTPICERRWEGICPFAKTKKTQNKNKHIVCVLLLNSPSVQGYCQQRPKTVNRSNLWRRNVYKTSTAPIQMRSTVKWCVCVCIYIYRYIHTPTHTYVDGLTYEWGRHLQSLSLILVWRRHSRQIWKHKWRVSHQENKRKTQNPQ